MTTSNTWQERFEDWSLLPRCTSPAEGLSEPSVKAFIEQELVRAKREAEKKMVEDTKKFVEWNKHDMGEMGEFIRVDHVLNHIDLYNYSPNVSKI